MSDTLNTILQINGGSTVPAELEPRELFISDDGSLYVGNSSKQVRRVFQQLYTNDGSKEILIGKTSSGLSFKAGQLEYNLTSGKLTLGSGVDGAGKTVAPCITHDTSFPYILMGNIHFNDGQITFDSVSGNWSSRFDRTGVKTPRLILRDQYGYGTSAPENADPDPEIGQLYFQIES